MTPGFFVFFTLPLKVARATAVYLNILPTFPKLLRRGSWCHSRFPARTTSLPYQNTTFAGIELPQLQLPYSDALNWPALDRVPPTARRVRDTREGSRISPFQPRYPHGGLITTTAFGVRTCLSQDSGVDFPCRVNQVLMFGLRRSFVRARGSLVKNEVGGRDAAVRGEGRESVLGHGPPAARETPLSVRGGRAVASRRTGTPLRLRIDLQILLGSEREKERERERESRLGRRRRHGPEARHTDYLPVA